ncbi:MAG: carbohydrate ABC transporter permease [Treponema sp.]|jgi:multiple sugar transport system permease protein|nr:carbohydrate ABC transporter permease [Treponema sp.]
MIRSRSYIAGKFTLKTGWILLMTLCALISTYPMIYGFLASLMTLRNFTSLGSLVVIPKNPTLQNYRVVFAMDGALKPLMNSFMRSAWWTLVNCSVAVLGGYSLARYEFKAKKAILVGIIVAQVIPGVLTMMPTFIMISRLPFVGGNNWLGQGGQGLINNRMVLYLPMGWGVFLWSFLFMQSVKSFPPSFEEAAEIDGYGFWSILFRIVLPMQGPILAVVAINSALGAWNDWMTPFLYINRTSETTLTAWLGTMIAQLQQFGVKDYPRVFAVATIAMIPPLGIFLGFQKFIIQGIASVGIKG